MSERFIRRLARLREHHRICEERHQRSILKEEMKTSHQEGQKRDEEDQDGQKRTEEDQDGQKRDDEDQDGQKRDEDDQDGQNDTPDFVQEVCIEEQSNQGNKDSSDLDESEGSVFVPSAEESTDEDDFNSEESEVEKTNRKTTKETIHSSKEALNTLQQSKWNKGDTIPLMEDVVALQKHLKSVEQISKEKLKENMHGAEWKILAETLLCQIILFNRRREGEASKLLLTSYVSRSVKPPNEDVVRSLTKLERELCNELIRLEIRGKRGKKVPVLLTKDMVESMDLLNKNRSKVGIQEANPYVFARLGALTHIRGSDCLRKFSKACGAKDPRSLTSTKLRKQIATLSQVMNLKNNELDQLAKFLGHDIRVHREYYRLSENTIQLAKVSKLLLSLEKGSDCYNGKSLEEIRFSTEEPENDTCPASRCLQEHECQAIEKDASENENKQPSTSRNSVGRKDRVTETDVSENENRPRSTSRNSVGGKRDVTETDDSENENQPLSTSRNSVGRKRRVTETDVSENENQPRSTSRNSVGRKRRVTETDDSENENQQPSTSRNSVRRSPAKNNTF